MYRQRIKISISILFFLNVLIACHKTSTPSIQTPNDFRDKWIGTYYSKMHIQSYGQCGTPYELDLDTAITVTKSTKDSILQIGSREIVLDSSQSAYGYHFSIHFQNDSLYMNYMNGGLGCGQYETTRGSLLHL